jgi:ABC-type glycerol-3-phosphate transport system permease component
VRRRLTWRDVLARVLVYAVLGTAAVAMAFPFYWMVVTTVRPEREAYTVALELLPSRLSLDVYAKLLGDPQLPVVRFFVNSLVIAGGATLVNVGTAVLAAFALARHVVPGGAVAYYAIVATMMVPGEVVLIGLFRVVNGLGLIDSYLGMILPLAVNAVNFLLVYNYLRALPRELDEAARVDGASTVSLLWHVMLPLARPVVYSAALLAFLSAWQNFTIPYLLAQTNTMYPLAVGALFTESTVMATKQETLTLATILTIPTLIVFVLTQRFVFSGITAGAVKG